MDLKLVRLFLFFNFLSKGFFDWICLIDSDQRKKLVLEIWDATHTVNCYRQWIMTQISISIRKVSLGKLQVVSTPRRLLLSDMFESLYQARSAPKDNSELLHFNWLL